MNAVVLLVATAVLGVDYGWQPTADGQLEYIIQIEPVTLIALRGGQDLVSQLDPYVRRVRRFRVRVGTELVPRRGTPPGEPQVASAAPPPTGVRYGWQPIDNQQMEFIIQVEPERLAAMRNGEDVSGEIPALVQNVARVRLRAGSGPLPQQGLQTAAAALPAQPWAAGGQARQVAAEVPDSDPDPRFAEPQPERAPELGPPASSLPAADRPQRPDQPQPPAASDSRAAAPAPDPTDAGRLRPEFQRQPDPVPSDRPPPSNAARLDEATGTANAEPQQPDSATGQRLGGPPAFDNGPLDPSSAAGAPAPPPRYDPLAAGAAEPAAPPSSGWGPQGTATADAPRATSVLPAAPAGPQTGQGPGGWAPAPPTAAAAAQGSWSTEPLYATAPQPELSSSSGSVAAAPPQVPQGQASPYTQGQASPYTQGQASPYPAQPTQSAQPGGGFAQPPPREPIPPAAPGYPGSPYPGGATAGQPAPPTTWPGQYGQTADPRWPADDAAVPVSQIPYRGGYPLPGMTGSRPLLPWEERLEGIERDRRAVELAENFWGELARTAHDPGLAFLREDGGSGDRPWGALTLTLLVMFASLGANLYMGWIAVDMYRRYLALADDLVEEEPRGRGRSRDDLLDDVDDLDDLQDPAPLRRRRRRATLAA